jgi:hypothetical protein
MAFLALLSSLRQPRGISVGYPGSLQYKTFLKRCADKFERVFVLAGNHEFYTTHVDQALSDISAEADLYPNVTFLNKTSLLVDGFRILGGHCIVLHAALVGKALCVLWESVGFTRMLAVEGPSPCTLGLALPGTLTCM